MSDDVTDAGRDSKKQGQEALPSTPVMIEVLRCMLVGEETPRCSGSSFNIISADTRLAVQVVDAVETLYTELGVPKGRSLPCTEGPVDREEGYGYLIADLMGSALVSAAGARSVGRCMHITGRLACRSIDIT